MPGFFGWTFVYLTLLYSWLGGFKHWLARKPDINCIKKHGFYHSGHLHSSNSVVLSLSKVKDVAKKHRATLNDVITALASTTLHEWFKLKGDKKTTISVGLPFAFRNIPRDVHQYEYGNQFVAATLYLKLLEKFEDAIAFSRAEVTRQVKQNSPAGWYLLVKAQQLFYGPAKNAGVNREAGAKYTLLLSNVPGFVKPTTIFGSPLKRFFYAGSGAGSITTGIYVVSVCKRLQINVTSSKSEIDDLPAFMEMLNRRISELGLDYNDE